jgi:hypothetical protein
MKILLAGEQLGPELTTPGEDLFRKPIELGGANCASCHTPFTKLQSTIGTIDNPETHVPFYVQLLADVHPVTFEYGMAAYSDFKRHKMGNLITDKVDQEGVVKDKFMTKELWGLGSSNPYLHDGSANANVKDAILAHRGTLLDKGNVRLSACNETILEQCLDGCTIKATLPEAASGVLVELCFPKECIDKIKLPIRVVVTKITAGNELLFSSNGSKCAPAVYEIDCIDEWGKASVAINFDHLIGTPTCIELAIADHKGYSEAVASAEAFKKLSPSEQESIVRFLKSLRLDDDDADDRGFEVGDR